ncbi:MAG: ComEC family competence protein, partial [Pseudomonadota bacterium]|nr:ComEC family competence protein [Pseudomonadota bacterium]
MEWVSAPNIEDAPLEPAPRRFSSAVARRLGERVEAFLETERAQLPLWFVASFGAGIAAWLWLPAPPQWTGVAALSLGIAAAGLAWGEGRLARALLVGGLALAAGCGWIWLRSERVAAPRLERPAIVVVEARVKKMESLVAKGDLRLTLAPLTGELPPTIRVSIPADGAPGALGAGARISVRARLQPPPPMALPGGHDFARDAWFQGRGAVGRAIGPVKVIEPAPGGGLDELRERLGQHIRAQLPESSGGVATAFANGDQAGVTEADAEAMRRSGLAHLLSVSGLHIAAAVGAAMLLSLRLLALSERLALRFNLVLVSAAIGAGAGVGYTLLTGMQVPTVRACIAALLVLGGIALGRDAISLRLVAVGALVVLLFRPE